MSPSPDSHICWGREPWFAWDLWNEVSGAPEQFELLLNGGYALAPSLVSISYGEGLEHTAVLPSVVEMEPAIGDYKPILEQHGIWHFWSTSGDTIRFYEPAEEEESETPVLADVRPHVWQALTVQGLGFVAVYRPWDIVPLPDADMDNYEEFDKTSEWLSAYVSGYSEGDRFSLDDLDAIYVEHEAKLDAQRKAWCDLLAGMAPRHACAELMLQELEQEMRKP